MSDIRHIIELGGVASHVTLHARHVNALQDYAAHPRGIAVCSPGGRGARFSALATLAYARGEAIAAGAAHAPVCIVCPRHARATWVNTLRAVMPALSIGEHVSDADVAFVEFEDVRRIDRGALVACAACVDLLGGFPGLGMEETLGRLVVHVPRLTVIAERSDVCTGLARALDLWPAGGGVNSNCPDVGAPSLRKSEPSTFI